MQGHYVHRRLYHYWNGEHGLWTLQKRRVRISRILELNDPFEFLALNLRDPVKRNALRGVKRELNRTRGILCFSENWNNPVMWAHYADRYKGVCLGFDVAESTSMGDPLLGQVKYVAERLRWPPEWDLQFAYDLLFTKFSHWGYEQEWRAFLSLDDCEESDGHYFKPFSDDLILREIYIGLSSPITRRTVNAATDGLRDVYIAKTRGAFQKFEVVKDRGVLA